MICEAAAFITMSSTIAMLNNQGLLHLEQGHYLEAVHHLTNALTLVKTALYTNPSCDELSCGMDEWMCEPIQLRCGTPYTSECAATSPSSVLAAATNEGTSYLKDMSSHVHAPQHAPTMCTRAVVLPITDDDAIISQCASTGLIYNLALAKHLQAMQYEHTNRNLCDVYLQKAVSLYRLANAIQIEQGLNADDNTIFALAVANNLAVIYNSRGHTEAAHHLYEHMLSICIYTIDCRRSRMSHSMTSSSKLETFFLAAHNALSRTNGEDQSAPAA